MSKKNLNESTVRRFMGLAGLQAEVISNKITETYGEKYENKPEEEIAESITEDELEGAGELPADDAGELPVDDAMPEPPAEEMGMGDQVDITPADAKALVDFADKLRPMVDQAEDDVEGEELPPMPDDAGEDMDPVDDELAEALDGVTTEATEEEIVQEVARRVAKRILLAKRAKKKLDEALGTSSKK